MTCKELKNKILGNELTFDCMFFVYKDDPFIARQYAEAIANAKGLEVVSVDSVDAIPEPDAFGTEDNNLYIMCEDEIKRYPRDFHNVIFICKRTNAEDIVEFPKIEDWQVLDYIRARCPGLTEDEAVWLQCTCKKDIHRIDSELKKISIFPKDQQTAIFNLLSSDGNYTDLNPRTLFDLTNAILRKDKRTLIQILNDIDSMDIEGMGLTTTLVNGVRNVIMIQFSKDATAESLGMKDGQFKAIKYYNVGKFTNAELVKVYEFLTSIDGRLKSGELQMSNDRLIDYIVCGVLAD